MRVFLDQSQSEVKHKQAFVWHDISSMSRDFRGDRLTVLYAGYKKLSKDGDWGGVTACSLSVLHIGVGVTVVSVCLEAFTADKITLTFLLFFSRVARKSAIQVWPEKRRSLT